MIHLNENDCWWLAEKHGIHTNQCGDGMIGIESVKDDFDGVGCYCGGSAFGCGNSGSMYRIDITVEVEVQL